MTILRSIKSEYKFYHYSKLDVIVALDAENQKRLIQLLKEARNKKVKQAHSKVKGYKMITDEEFGSLKIDFSSTYSFEIDHLEKTKLV